VAAPIQIPFAFRTRAGPGNHVLDRGPDIPIGRGNYGGKNPLSVKGVSAVSCARTAQPIDLPFGSWARVGQKKHKFNRICQVAPMCPNG